MNMSKKNAIEYPVVIRQLSDSEGGGYLAEFPDLPGCLADGETPEEALAESRAALASYLASLEKHGDSFPSPAPGVWRQRAPKTLHRRLQQQADREGVSLNTLVVSILAEGLGRRAS